jgi:hypothetical protein
VFSGVLEEGNVFGLMFPTSSANYPHPGILLKIYDTENRDERLKSRGIKAKSNLDLCLFLMISHSYPPRGEYAEIIDDIHKENTNLDRKSCLYMCYNHFEAALMPASQRIIGSVNSPYLGKLDDTVLAYYKLQFTSIQSYKKNRSFAKPSGMFLSL